MSKSLGQRMIESIKMVPCKTCGKSIFEGMIDCLKCRKLKVDWLFKPAKKVQK